MPIRVLFNHMCVTPARPAQPPQAATVPPTASPHPFQLRRGNILTYPQPIPHLKILMASATAAQQRPALRVASRRAQLLLQRTRGGAKQQQPGGGSSPFVPPAKKPEEAPWPDSVRYPFYALLAASAPFAAGQALALSPRLRDSVLGDDCRDEDDDDDYKGRVLSWVRRTWGREEYVPPVDLLTSLVHATPGHRKSWQEDDYSSLLQMFGLYHHRGDDVVVLLPAPSSLDNEPPHRIRREQAALSRTLSDPSGVRAKLTLLPSRVASASSGAIPHDDDDIDATAAYETERSFPGNVSASALRRSCPGSDARFLVQELLAGGRGEGGGTNNYERIRTRGWNEECRWAVTFPDDDGDDDGGGDPEEGGDDDGSRGRNASASPSSWSDGASSTSSLAAAAAAAAMAAALHLRRNTAIRSSWTHFPDAAVVAAPLASSLGSVAASSASVSSSSSAAGGNAPSYDAKSLLVQGLEYRISALESELRDPSCMRDRDDMREELASARREMRSLKPWWKRGWGW